MLSMLRRLEHNKLLNSIKPEKFNPNSSPNMQKNKFSNSGYNQNKTDRTGRTSMTNRSIDSIVTVVTVGILRFLLKEGKWSFLRGSTIHGIILKSRNLIICKIKPSRNLIGDWWYDCFDLVQTTIYSRKNLIVLGGV